MEAEDRQLIRRVVRELEASEALGTLTDAQLAKAVSVLEQAGVVDPETMLNVELDGSGDRPPPG